MFEAGQDMDEIGRRMERWRQLPEMVREMGMNSSTSDYINEGLGPRFNLSPEQLSGVSYVIRDLLLADLHIGDLVRALETELVVDRETATRVADAICTELLRPVIAEITRHRNRFGNRTE
jgi:hypothetical protein